jgi:hypothetical protein
MRERKYIRFDFAQALHTRATSVERADYRIIARTRAVYHSLASALAYAVHFVTAARLHAAQTFCAALDASSFRSSFAHIFCASPRLSVVRAAAIHCAAEAASYAQRQYAEQRHCLRRAYQIETMRMLIAIEFFFVVIINFLSMRRCNCRLRQANRDEGRVIRSAIRLESHTPRRFLSASLTACGLALPPVDFIT